MFDSSQCDKHPLQFFRTIAKSLEFFPASTASLTGNFTFDFYSEHTFSCLSLFLSHLQRQTDVCLYLILHLHSLVVNGESSYFLTALVSKGFVLALRIGCPTIT